MAETHQVVTKVWIAPGCIVCDACENECPEVFDVQEETCIIRPPALATDFLKPLTPTVIAAAEACPVDVIKFDLQEVPGEAPWANQPVAEVSASASASHAAPSAKATAPLGPPDPKWQALLSNSKISPSLSAGLGTTIRKSPEVAQSEDFIKQVDTQGIDWENAPPDQRMAMLAVGGAYQPKASMGQRIRDVASKAGSASKSSRREFNFALMIAWGAVLAVTATWGAMFQDFFGPKVLKEPKKQWRAGRMDEFSVADTVNEKFKQTPDGGSGFWLVNLQPNESKLVAISVICTHLGCIPAWLSGDRKFKCPCHGSGYYMTGVNFEGPTPRPLERFSISKDADGYIVVDMSKVYRSELGQWDDPESFVPLV
jgi:cytochrome b6-f complex iron-sulfur subunit